MAATFFDRIAELRHQVGDGDLVIRTRVDQVYAKYQELTHPVKRHGGRMHYARDALYEHASEHLQTLAESALTDLGGGAIEVADRLREQTETYAPVEYHNLNRSGASEVTDEGEVVYHRPPDVPRLSEEQLRRQRWHGHDVDYGARTRPRFQ